MNEEQQLGGTAKGLQPTTPTTSQRPLCLLLGRVYYSREGVSCLGSARLDCLLQAPTPRGSHWARPGADEGGGRGRICNPHPTPVQGVSLFFFFCTPARALPTPTDAAAAFPRRLSCSVCRSHSSFCFFTWGKSGWQDPRGIHTAVGALLCRCRPRRQYF